MRHRAAVDLHRELEAAPGRQRLEGDVAYGELAVPAGLLHVPAVALHLAGERLAQRHPQRHLFDIDAVLAVQPVDEDVGMRLAHAPQHELVRLDVAFEPHGRLLRDDPLQTGRQFVFVGLALGLNRNR